jgi:hypothetical protein
MKHIPSEVNNRSVYQEIHSRSRLEILFAFFSGRRNRAGQQNHNFKHFAII